MPYIKYTDEQVTNAVKQSRSVSEVQRVLGAGLSGSSHQWIKKRINQLELDISHFDIHWNNKNNGGGNKLHHSQILQRRTDTRQKSYQLRRAMLEHGFAYQCAICGISDWQDKLLKLEIEHKDGNNLNNEAENLCFLCPNCHSQTSTFGYCGKR